MIFHTNFLDNDGATSVYALCFVGINEPLSYVFQDGRVQFAACAETDVVDQSVNQFNYSLSLSVIDD